MSTDTPSLSPPERQRLLAELGELIARAERHREEQRRAMTEAINGQATDAGAILRTIEEHIALLHLTRDYLTSEALPEQGEPRPAGKAEGEETGCGAGPAAPQNATA